MPQLHPVKATTVSFSKAGNDPAENEDAAAVSTDGLHFAISDGATEGWDSGPWARQLVNAYVSRPPNLLKFPEWIAAVRSGWARRKLPDASGWYLEEKQSQGSFATLLGLELKRSKLSDGWVWRAAAIGDSCLFHIGSGCFAAAFPLSSPQAFGCRPPLVSSSRSHKCPPLSRRNGRVAPGDLLLLATDTVAASLLKLADASEWNPMLKAVGETLHTGDPTPLKERLVSFQSVTNDDMTLTAISIE